MVTQNRRGRSPMISGKAFAKRKELTHLEKLLERIDMHYTQGNMQDAVILMRRYLTASIQRNNKLRGIMQKKGFNPERITTINAELMQWLRELNKSD